MEPLTNAVISTNTAQESLSSAVMDQTVSNDSTTPLSPVYKRPKDDVSIPPNKLKKRKEKKEQIADDPKLSDSDESKESESSPDHSSNDERKTEEVSHKFPVEVFVRIRPLVGREVEEEHESTSFTVKTSKKKGTKTLNLKKGSNRKTEINGDDDTANMSAAQKRLHRRLKSRNPAVKYQGFKDVLVPSDGNMATFTKCILPALPSIMRGEKTCAFAYGHTGSGKTHTITGYGPDNPGMFQLFAGTLLNRIKDFDDILVEIRFTEMYQGKLYDLLTKPKTECTIRENEDGSCHIAIEPTLGDDGMMRENTITSLRVTDLDELLKHITDGIRSRKCGLSTLHDQSSRSHAFLEFELVSTELVELRKLLVDLKAKHLFQTLLYDKMKYDKLPAHKGMAEYVARAAQEFEQQIRAKRGAMNAIPKEMKRLEKEIKKCEKRIKRVLSDESDERKQCVGGTMCFVDLAGNEYGRDVKNKNKGEERERNDINKSLLALKECIRALHNKRNHVGFRSSKLTRYLKEYLCGERTHAIMINCIGSSREYQKQSVNTLQYAALMAKI